MPNELWRLSAAQLVAAVAAQGTQDIPGHATAVHPYQHRFIGVPVAFFQRHMHFTGIHLAEGNQFELAVFGGHLHPNFFADEGFGAEPVFDQVFDGYEFQSEFLSDQGQFRQPGHSTVFVHDFHQYACGRKASHTGHIHGGFGMAGAAEYASFFGPEGEDVTGAAQVLGFGRGIYQRQDGFRPVLSRNTCGTTVSEQVDAHGKSRFVERCIVRNHGLQLQFIAPLFAERGADQATAMGRHEIDRVGGRHLRRDDQVALIFAILVVDEDEHAAIARLGDDFFRGGHRRQVAAVREPVLQLAQRVGGGVPAFRIEIAKAVGVKARGARQSRAGHGPFVDDGADTVDELCGHDDDVSHHNVIVNPDITFHTSLKPSR